MSCRSVTFAADQQSFLDEDACLRLISSCEDGDRPRKRRKVENEEDGLNWASILDLVAECRFNEVDCPSSSAATNGTPLIPVGFTFEDPIMTVFDYTGRELFAFVCQDPEVEFCTEIGWLENLSMKDPSVAQCIRLSTSLSFRHHHLRFESATLLFRLEVRFDQHLFGVKKLSLKDRVSILDYVFENPAIEVTADTFYADIGKLPKDYIDSKDNSLQHQGLECKLFPFQKRAVAWMLRREGVKLEDESQRKSPGPDDLPPLWEATTDRHGEILYLNRHQGFATRDQSWISTTFPKPTIPGGILAEVWLFDLFAFAST
jgi:hypothetical protein